MKRPTTRAAPVAAQRLPAVPAALRLVRAALVAALPLACATSTVAAEANSEPADAEGRVIRSITLARGDVFDLSDPREDRPLYRLANRLHILTREAVIRRQLLIKPGKTYRQRLADESERLLRGNAYLFDADISATVTDDGEVDVEVATRDVWTLQPVLSLSRAGGENETALGFEEFNLLGRGQALKIERFEDVDRESSILEFSDRQIGASWIGASVALADNSDGHSRFGSLVRPFFALDTRYAAGVSVLDAESIESFYALGERVARYGQDRRYVSAWGGKSPGLENGWVRRVTAGIVLDETRYAAVPDAGLPSIVPADRNLRYPFVGIEILQDRFDEIRNREQMARTEDFYMGTRFTARIGWSDTGFGADRDALVFSSSLSRGFGSIADEALLVSANAAGRIESGDAVDARLHVNARYFRQQSSKRVLYATLDATRSRDPDPDRVPELGGDTGLRGYPLRYQAGDARVLFTVEQRYFWDWYPWRLFRVGGAIFADVGRVWGDSPGGGASLGWLRDLGIGLRFASTRGGVSKVVHLDIAFPLDGDASIDAAQLILEAKRSF